MKSFRKIDDLVQYIEKEDKTDPGIGTYRAILNDNSQIIDLLRLLETVNPCGQVYYLNRGVILVSYRHHLNLLNFTRKFSLKARVRIIGLPISLSITGILVRSDVNTIEKVAIKAAIQEVLMEMDGLSLLLNSDDDLSGDNRTLSAFVFPNCFPDFQSYLDALRAPYRRKISKVLDRGRGLQFFSIPPSEFTDQHYALYRSIMERTSNPLETLPVEFFREYDANIIEVKDRESRLVGFMQMKGTGSTLYFMFCGFRKEHARTRDKDEQVATYKEKEADSMSHIDLYYNMLLFIIRYGIEHGYERIEMGQTSEETKLKLGCVEVNKYLLLHHRNPILNTMLQKLAPRFSYQGYETTHHVFKEEQKSCNMAFRERETG